MKEFDKEFYNEAYKTGGSGGEYFKKPEDCIYFPIWETVCNKLSNTEPIFEIGCGVGQLAEYLVKKGKNYLTGIDFSEVAIEQAQRRLISRSFEVKDVYTLKKEEIDGNTVICLEVLEHLEKDLEIFELLPSKTRLIFSVPDYMSKSHVRSFQSSDEIWERYGKYLHTASIQKFVINKKGSRIFLVDSIIA